MVISKKTITFQGFRGGPTCSRGGGPTFSRGGPNANFYRTIETHITCDFPGGSRPPNPPLDPLMSWLAQISLFNNIGVVYLISNFV